MSKIRHFHEPYWLYRTSTITLQKCNFDILVFRPFLFKHFTKGFKKSLLTDMGWYILCGGKIRVYYILNANKKVIHYSYVMGKSFKFPFMNNKDLMVSPCWTSPEMRGLHIYPEVLNYIRGNCEHQFGCVENIYLLVRKSNIPSIKGVERAGYKKAAAVNKSRKLKLYNEIEWL